MMVSTNDVSRMIYSSADVSANLIQGELESDVPANLLLGNE